MTFKKKIEKYCKGITHELNYSNREETWEITQSQVIQYVKLSAATNTLACIKTAYGTIGLNVLVMFIKNRLALHKIGIGIYIKF